jgi:HSP20 family molecular chaperone IbpA
MFEFSKQGLYDHGFSDRQNSYRPPVDVIELENDFVVRVEIAGMRENDFNIRYEKGILTVLGNRKDPHKANTFHQMEIRYGDFRIDILLNQPIVANSIGAVYDNGFLEIRLNKAVSKEIHITNKETS